MSVYGNIRTMSLPDLLQWASVNKKTGVLELERNKICTRISFRNGRIVACSSDDPPSRLGQFLLSRGKITKEQLRQALSRQERTGQNLGMILQEMSLLTREEIEIQVAAKAEENIYGLFDWTDAVFRFHEDAASDSFIIEVDLSVQYVVLRGIQRFDDLQRIRDAFNSSGIVLARTKRPTPSEIVASPMAKRVLESVNGSRTLAEILLHAHASEFLVAKFLYALYKKGIVTIAEVRPVDPNSRTLLDTAPPQAVESTQVPTEGAAGPSGIPVIGESADPNRQIETVLQHMAGGDYAAALEILNGYYQNHSDDKQLRQLLLKAEAGYLDQARSDKFEPTKIPVPLKGAADPTQTNLKPTELFLLTMLDGKSDIKSIMWVAPLREVDVLKALQRMLDEGLIELRDAREDQAGPEDREVRSVQWSPV